MKHVLVTGSAGRIGRAVTRELSSRGHHVVGFDRVPTPGIPPEQSIVADLSHVDTIRSAMVGVDAVIHLAATPDDDHFPPKPGENNFLSSLVPNNIIGSYHIIESARAAGVKKVILASTAQVVEGHVNEGNFPVTASSSFRPRYLYASTKVFLEMLGQAYSAQHQLTVLCVRLGWCPRDAGQVATIQANRFYQDTFLSPGDAGRFFTAAIEANLPRYAVCYVTSRPLEQTVYDLEPARLLTGYTPQDHWPQDADAR